MTKFYLTRAPDGTPVTYHRAPSAGDEVHAPSDMSPDEFPALTDYDTEPMREQTTQQLTGTNFLLQLIGGASGNLAGVLRTVAFIVTVIWFVSSWIQKVETSTQRTEHLAVMIDTLAARVNAERPMLDMLDDYRRVILPMVYDDHSIISKHFPRDVDEKRLERRWTTNMGTR